MQLAPAQPPQQQNYLLAKLGEPEHMVDLVVNGTVFTQRLCAFKKIEDGGVRGDKNEALAFRFDESNPTLRVKVTIGEKTMDLRTASLVVHSTERDHGVYCMYAFPVSRERGPFTLDIGDLIKEPRTETFGKALVIFRDSQEFIHRLGEAAKLAGYGLEGQAVEYVGMDYCGAVGPFRKLESYRYQSEYRFVTMGPIPGKSLSLKLGSLHDIAVAVDLSTEPPTRLAASGR